MDTPYIGGYAAIPKSHLTKVRIEQLKKKATVNPVSFNSGAKKDDDEEEDRYTSEDKEARPPINGWRETDKFLYLPISLGVIEIRRLGLHTMCKNYTSLGQKVSFPILPDPNHAQASAGQAVFCDDLLDATKRKFSVLGVADTGNGKTAVALHTIGKLGRNALIVVPGETLGCNWRDEIKKHLGLTDDEIGWVQQKKCNYVGKKIVIAVVHSLCRRAYPPAFYKHFGTVVYDEVHSMAATTFSKTLGKIYARYKLAITATPTRKDGCQNLFLNYFGHTPVTAKNDPPAPCTALVQKYFLPFEDGKFPEVGALAINILSKLKSRNQLIINWISKLRKKRRTILVVSDRIDQLSFLLEECHRQLGIPRRMMCVYAKQRMTERGRVKVTLKELQRYKKDPTIKIYFATYGVFRQGENIPRLDAGIEATPRADGIQAPGRVRRRLPGKPRSVWLTIQDLGSPQLARKYKSRLRDFKKAQITVCHV